MASRGWFDPGFVVVKRLVLMMAFFRFLDPFRLLLLISLKTFLVSHSSVLDRNIELKLLKTIKDEITFRLIT